jgi:hypothetical protein
MAYTRFHNVAGGRLLGTGYWSDSAIPAVATRPPQLDAWTGWAAEEVLCSTTSRKPGLCERRLATAVDKPAERVVHLGDVLNISGARRSQER